MERDLIGRKKAPYKGALKVSGAILAPLIDNLQIFDCLVDIFFDIFQSFF